MAGILRRRSEGSFAEIRIAAVLEMTKPEWRMPNETRIQKSEVALIQHLSFVIHSSFLILVSSFCPHTCI